MTIYKISRGSGDSFTSKPPIEGAVQKYFPCYDVRVFKSFAEYEAKLRRSFLSVGSEHKELPGAGISRRVADELLWCIEINTLEDLQKLVQKEGQLVIDEDSIRIYDDYIA